jgi:hypothetical protein
MGFVCLAVTFAVCDFLGLAEKQRTSCGESKRNETAENVCLFFLGDWGAMAGNREQINKDYSFVSVLLLATGGGVLSVAPRWCASARDLGFVGVIKSQNVYVRIVFPLA